MRARAPIILGALRMGARAPILSGRAPIILGAHPEPTSTHPLSNPLPPSCLQHQHRKTTRALGTGETRRMGAHTPGHSDHVRYSVLLLPRRRGGYHPRDIEPATVLVQVGDTLVQKRHRLACLISRNRLLQFYYGSYLSHFIHS